MRKKLLKKVCFVCKQMSIKGSELDQAVIVNEEGKYFHHGCLKDVSSIQQVLYF